MGLVTSSVQATPLLAHQSILSLRPDRCKAKIPAR